MARKEKPIISITGSPSSGNAMPNALNAGIDRFLAIQRPLVLAHVRSIRRRHPQASPEEVIRILGRRYLGTVTASGTAVGVTAVVPAIGTGLTLALSGAETAAFLEATALYTQSLSEVHGIAVNDPERARALVLTMMLGREGSDLVRQLAGQATGTGVSRRTYWGEMITSTLPATVIRPLGDKLRSTFLRRFAVRGGAGIIGRAIPFGIGAVVGGVGNNVLGRRVVHTSVLAFGQPPTEFPPNVAPRPGVIVVTENQPPTG
jgi:hypothetical protein